MAERILDKLYRLHVNTLDPLTSTCHDATYHSLCARIFKEDQYIKHVNYGRPSDVTVKALVLAYIMGMRSHGKKRYAELFDDYDMPFYKGIWELICEQVAPKGMTYNPMPILSDKELYVLYADPDVTRFNIQSIVDEFVAFNVLNDGKYVTRNKVARDVIGLPDKWLSVHYQMEKRDGRPLPLDKILMFMFGAYKLATEKFPAPRKDFWLDYATYAWHRVQYELIDDIEAAEEYRKQYAREDFGFDKKITFRSLLK